MNKKQSDWQLPEETRGLLWSMFFMPAVSAAIVLGASLLLPLFSRLERVDVSRLFSVGLAASVAGVAVLFFAKLPLYREGRYLTFGPRKLDRFHHALYWLAYLFAVSGVVLLGAIWLRPH